MPKWASFQKWVSRQLYKAGLNSKVNGQAHGGFGVPDVEADPFYIECKMYKTLSSKTISEAIKQSKLGCHKSDKYPIAICKDDSGEIIVAMDFTEFKNLVQEFITKS